jgi:hypothetical protein
MRPGEILSRAFQLYVRHRRTLLAIMAIALPLAAANLESHALQGRHQISVYHNVVGTTSTGMSIAAVVVAGTVMLLAFSLVTGAIISAAATASAGADPSMRRSYRFGFTRLGSLVPVIFLLWLAVVAGFTLLILPGLHIGVLLAMSVPRADDADGRTRRRVALPGTAGTQGTRGSRHNQSRAADRRSVQAAREGLLTGGRFMLTKTCMRTAQLNFDSYPIVELPTAGRAERSGFRRRRRRRGRLTAHYFALYGHARPAETQGCIAVSA